MEPEDILIKLKTEGDTSGAEAVEDSIFAVEDATKAAQRESDVQEVKARAAAKAQREQAEVLREIADGQQRIVAANLAGALTKIGDEFKGISDSTDMAISAAGNFLSVFASTGNPVIASLALIGTAINGVMDSFREASKQEKQIAKDQEAHLKKIAELRSQYYQQVRTENLVSYFDRELTSLDNQEKALMRISKIRASERAAAAAEQQASSEAGVRGGDDPRFAAARDAVVSVGEQIAEVNAQLEDQKKQLAMAQEKATILSQEAKALVASQGEGGAEAMKAVEAANKAADAAEQAKLDFAAEQEIAQNEIRAIVATGTEKITATAREAFETSSTQTAEDLKASLEAIATAQKGVLSQPAKQALESANKILADGKSTLEEAQMLENAIRAYKSSREAATQQMQGYLQSLITNEQTIVNTLNRYGAAIDMIMSRLK